ncbi:hypothetical protein GCM10027259_25890 [Micromonospora palomenae]
MGAIDILKGWPDAIPTLRLGEGGDGIRPGWTVPRDAPPPGRPDDGGPASAPGPCGTLAEQILDI